MIVKVFSLRLGTQVILGAVPGTPQLTLTCFQKMCGDNGAPPTGIQSSPVAPNPDDAAVRAATDHSVDLPTTPERVRSPRRDSVFAAGTHGEPETSLGDEFSRQVDATRQALLILRPPPEVPRPPTSVSHGALSAAPSWTIVGGSPRTVAGSETGERNDDGRNLSRSQPAVTAPSLGSGNGVGSNTTPGLGSGSGQQQRSAPTSRVPEHTIVTTAPGSIQVLGLSSSLTGASDQPSSWRSLGSAVNHSAECTISAVVTRALGVSLSEAFGSTFATDPTAH